MISIPSWDRLIEIKFLYEGDPKLTVLRQAYQAGQLPQQYSVCNGVIFYKQQAYVPANRGFILKLLQLVHNSPSSGGHLGFDKTISQVRRDSYWLGQRTDVRNFLRECDICQVTKVDNTLHSGLLQPLPIPS